MPAKVNKETRDKILACIVQGIMKEGLSPTVREIAKAVGLSSPASVAFYLEKLQAEGEITKDKRGMMHLAQSGEPDEALPAVNGELLGYIQGSGACLRALEYARRNNPPDAFWDGVKLRLELTGRKAEGPAGE